MTDTSNISSITMNTSTVYQGLTTTPELPVDTIGILQRDLLEGHTVIHSIEAIASEEDEEAYKINLLTVSHEYPEHLLVSFDTLQALITMSFIDEATEERSKERVLKYCRALCNKEASVVDVIDFGYDIEIPHREGSYLKIIYEGKMEGTVIAPSMVQQLNSAINGEPLYPIPLNSPSLTMQESTSRFSGALWYDEIRKSRVTLVGVGGIGSYIGFLLGRLRIAHLTLIDPDTVEEGNLSGQLYNSSSIGKSKVDALSSIIQGFSGFHNMHAIEDRFDRSFEINTKIVICGLDNMEARRCVFNKWLEAVDICRSLGKETGDYLFIDGRLAAEELQVLAIKGDNEKAIREYREKWLFSSSEAEPTMCSYKQTSFMANMIGSIIVNIFVNFIANKCNPIIDRDIPFFTYYTADTMFFKVETI
jgi:hypothetical protein